MGTFAKTIDRCISRLRFDIKKFVSFTHFRMQKCQTFVDIFYFVDSHFAIIGLAKFLAWNNFQQFEELYAISQVREKVFNLHFCLRNVQIEEAKNYNLMIK